MALYRGINLTWQDADLAWNRTEDWRNVTGTATGSITATGAVQDLGRQSWVWPTTSVDFDQVGPGGIAIEYLTDIADNRTAVTVTRTGTPVVSTSESQFGGASYFSDNQNSRLVAENANDVFAFGTGDFTLEAWVYFDQRQGATQTLFDKRATGATVGQPAVFINIDRFRYFTEGAYRITSTTVPVNKQWYHVAVVRSAGVSKLYVNGRQEGVSYTDTGDYPGTDINIAGRFSPISGTLNSIEGYVDEVRVSNTARYTTDFSPATGEFVNDDDTLLLLHMNGENGSTVFEDDTRTFSAPQAPGALFGRLFRTRIVADVDALYNYRTELSEETITRSFINVDTATLPGTVTARTFDFEGDFSAVFGVAVTQGVSTTDILSAVTVDATPDTFAFRLIDLDTYGKIAVDGVVNLVVTGFPPLRVNTTQGTVRRGDT